MAPQTFHEKYRRTLKMELQNRINQIVDGMANGQFGSDLTPDKLGLEFMRRTSLIQAFHQSIELVDEIEEKLLRE